MLVRIMASILNEVIDMISFLKIEKKTFFLCIILIVLYLCFDIYSHLLKINKDYIFKRYEQETDEEYYEKEGAFIELSMINMINQKKDRVIMTVYSKEKFDNFELNSIVVSFDERVNKISKQLKISNCELKYKPSSISGNELYCYQMKYYGNSESKYSVNFYNIFNTVDINIGNIFPVNFIVNFSLDNNIYCQNLKYQVSCVEAEKYPPNWFMFFFPGAW